MVAMSIIGDYPAVALLSPILASVISWLLMRFWVTKSLVDLQVAFKVDEFEYEVHTITRTRKDAAELLSHPRSRIGVRLYILSLVGVCIIILELLLVWFGLYDGYYSYNLGLALLLILVPALASTAFALFAQISPSKSSQRATMQEESVIRNGMIIIIGILWVLMIALLHLVLSKMVGMSNTNLTSTILFVAMLPAIIAYGRVLGSSWLPLLRSSWLMSQGKPSQLHPSIPSPSKQAVAFLVAIAAFSMPITAINTLITLAIITFRPGFLAHSQQVLGLPEYTEQAVVMEEGGLIGFIAIELFSYIPVDEIRIPMVTAVLLFLLLNVAVIGIAFVFDVAKILFLGISDICGKGGIKVAESRMLRAEKRQQANVLNFCFSAFAGQSMFLLFLALITFWDSTFLPQGAACGPWEDSVCLIFEKDAMEQLTWMMAAGGQLAFLTVWLMSREMKGVLDKIHFDASVGSERKEMAAWEDVIFLQQTPLNKLIAEGDWQMIINRWEHQAQGPSGLTSVRRAKDEMLLMATIGNWDRAEQLALSVLALKGGESKEARLILAAASIIQRDFHEASPRLARLRGKSQQAMHLEWIGEIIDPEVIEFPESMIPMCSVDPLAKLNKDLLQRWLEWQPWSNIKHRNDAIGRKFLLGDIARMRICGQSIEALDRLEYWIHRNNVDKWLMGDIARALLMIDNGMALSARQIRRSLAEKNPRHPAVRALQSLMLELGLESQPMDAADSSKFDWLVDNGTSSLEERRKEWLSFYNVIPFEGEYDAISGKHMMDGNCWLMHNAAKKVGIHPSAVKAKVWGKAAGWPRAHEQPVGNFLISSGLIAKIEGVAIDMGLPAAINLEDPRVKLVLELD